MHSSVRLEAEGRTSTSASWRWRGFVFAPLREHPEASRARCSWERTNRPARLAASNAASPQCSWESWEGQGQIGCAETSLGLLGPQPRNDVEEPTRPEA